MKTQNIIMEIKGTITFSYKEKKIAEIIAKSLEVDNENFLETKLENEKITYTISSKKIGSFLLTVDDLIACEILAEKIIT